MVQTVNQQSEARLAQSAERKALNLVVVGSSPTVGAVGTGPSKYRPVPDRTGPVTATKVASETAGAALRAEGGMPPDT